MSEALQVEATGETVGEAKWSALRELEKLQPGIDKAAVRFQVVSEGERGLLGVGYAPARVIATVDSAAVVAQPEAPEDESELAHEVREVLDRILEAISVRAHVEFREQDETVVATLTGRELGLVIGKHGQTIDAIQYLVNAIVWRERGDERKPIVVDAAGLASGDFGAAASAGWRGGVREERFGGGSPFFGISCRVISPWPTVHRFVVTQ